MASACLRSWSDRGPLCGWLSQFIQAPQRNLNNQQAFWTEMDAGWLIRCLVFPCLFPADQLCCLIILR